MGQKMDYEKCTYCGDFLEDPHDIIIGTHRFSTPKLYHHDCFDRVRKDRSSTKRPNSHYMPENISEIVKYSKYRFFSLVFVLLSMLIAIIYLIVDGGNEPEASRMGISIGLIIVITIFITPTIITWRKYRKYLLLDKYLNSLKLDF
ncbi:MAG: hypothetical protein ACMUHY_06395 [Thermoplasmatota archaeon]